MANTQSSQAFYSLTLEPSSAVTAACTCNVIPGLKLQDQQIFEARGQRLYLHRVIENEDRTEVKVTTFLDQDVFGIVRGVSSFRIPGTGTDQLVVSSDSGRVILLNYNAQKNTFDRIHMETFGKSGIRRTIPGQYLAGDPRGRCFMLASTEKNKVVFIVSRSAEGGVAISSPHEANQGFNLCFALCALDTGWEHPIFAALEVNYKDSEYDPSGEEYARREKELVYYTVDLGLNHVLRSWSDTVDYTANMLFGVPGGQDGPSGVLVCCEDRIFYRHDKNQPLCIPIPRREGPMEDPNRKRSIVAGCLHLSRAQKKFFFLLQTEDGDVFKLTMTIPDTKAGQKSAQPERINLKYYETFPVAKQMLLIRKGYIYVAAENGNNKLYHVNDLAEDLDFEPHNNFTSDGYSTDPADDYTPLFFKPRGLVFAALATDIPALHPLVRTQVDNPLNEDAPQIYGIQGTGNRSIFKTIRHGLRTQELVSSDLGNVEYSNLWSLKHRSSDPYHSYLLLSSDYADKTIVLSIGDEVETMEDSPFLTNRATIEARLMGDATLVQVHARGVRSILESGTINEWPTPSHRTIVAASANDHQLLLGLSSAELAFFFMGEDGVLNQLEEMPEMSGKVTALSVGATPRGQMQAKFAVVGCDDSTIRVLSIELDSPLEARSVQALSAVPSSLEIVRQTDPGSDTAVTYVHIGLVSGVYLRAVIDEVTGELGEVRSKFLGSKAARLFPVKVNRATIGADGADVDGGESSILATSSRPWLGYNHPLSHVYTLAPLVTAAPLDAARSFISEHINGLCAIQGSTLLIFELGALDGRLVKEEISLPHTPRSMCRYGERWFVVGCEANSVGGAVKGLIENGGTYGNGADVKMDGDGDTEHAEANGVADKEAQEALDRHLGFPRAMGHCVSSISALDPYEAKAITDSFAFEVDEAALCCAIVAFENRQWENFLVVGTAKNGKGGVHVFRLGGEGEAAGLVWLMRTEFSHPIYALIPFHGRVAIGVGAELFIYDLGMKALLRKARGAAVPNQIVSLQAQGNRIIAGDISESVTFIVYKGGAHNRFIPFVDDSIQRWTTATTMLDYETVAGGDKFGNLWVLRCPDQASKEADEEGIGGHIVNERSYLGGAPYRLEGRAHFYTQDIPMSLQRTSLVAGGQEVLFWSGLEGTLGIMVPFVSREDVEFFSQLESQLRQEDAPLAGRDHMMYRSYYVPVKGVVDGDLCERFLRLSVDTKAKIAAEVDREVREVERKVLEMRTRVAF